MQPDVLGEVNRPRSAGMLFAFATVVAAGQPAEIAFSFVAALLDVRRPRVGLLAEQSAPRQEAVDPICGMTVHAATAAHRSERNGQTCSFRCTGCQARFEAT